MSHSLVERAPAKINLSLHVLGRRDDGYHELESLVAFTRSGDLLSWTPGESLRFVLDGPTAADSGTLEDNLAVKAVRNLAERVEGLKLGTLHLTKNLPVAAGIGGGSSDAAAALRLAARANALSADDPRLLEAARTTGADVPVCLDAQARMMAGIGEKLGPILSLPPLPVLIVNPRQKLETKSVFARMKIAPGTRTSFGSHPVISSNLDFETLIAALRKSRNDMEDAACVLAPIVSDVLAVLAAAPGCRLARMSGSGATCFGIFADCRAVARAKKTILDAHRDWWVKAAMLN
ncbi:MAG TPA: 4-(cytidine 5'-diphospho)-2-C-methyl-D-erythritol kinase [Methylovirgula sp.]|nr:4-(cytidine 5'-diphospho)-2-C-methyl-D-erythritol kinase [Methylovirgula sp.]